MNIDREEKKDRGNSPGTWKEKKQRRLHGGREPSVFQRPCFGKRVWKRTLWSAVSDAAGRWRRGFGRSRPSLLLRHSRRLKTTVRNGTQALVTRGAWGWAYFVMKWHTQPNGIKGRVSRASVPLAWQLARSSQAVFNFRPYRLLCGEPGGRREAASTRSLVFLAHESSPLLAGRFSSK